MNVIWIQCTCTRHIAIFLILICVILDRSKQFIYWKIKLAIFFIVFQFLCAGFTE